MTDIILFNPTEIATLGNKFLGAIVAHEIAVEEAQAEIQRGAKREQFIDMEFIKSLMHLHKDPESNVDLYRVFGDKKDAEVLNRSILLSLGVLVRKVTDDDRVEYNFTDPALADQYYFPREMGDPKKESESDEAYATRLAEYTKRRSRRNALNIRITRCAKAAIALMENNATAENIVYREAPTGGTEIVLTAGPKAVMGEEKEVVIVTGNAAKAKGASQTPTLSGIIKTADDTHKEKPAAKADSGEGATRKETDGNVNTASQDFLALANAMLLTIRGRENAFDEAEKALLRNLKDEIALALKAVAH